MGFEALILNTIFLLTAEYVVKYIQLQLWVVLAIFFVFTSLMKLSKNSKKTDERSGSKELRYSRYPFEKNILGTLSSSLVGPKCPLTLAANISF